MNEPSVVASAAAATKNGRSANSRILTDLIVAVARGDETAFEHLYVHVSPQLFGIILRMVRDRPTAEDVLQDVFVRIWTKASSYDPDAGEPLPWLTSIARHRAIDALRAAPPLRRIDDANRLLDSIAAPSAREELDLRVLQSCLDALGPEMRECVLLAYCAGYSGKDLAERHGRPENTIKSWLRRGLSSLRTCLDKRA